jgi:hypothetical protein
VFSCHASAGERRVTCIIYDPDSAGQMVTANLVPMHNRGNAEANGSGRGRKGIERITLRASRKLGTGKYLISLTYNHGRGTYTMRQTVYLR